MDDVPHDISIAVSSIHCSSCENYIRSILSAVPHIRNLTVDLIQRSLSFDFDSETLTSPSKQKSLLHSIQDLLSNAGYDSKLPSTSPAKSLFSKALDTALGEKHRRRQRHIDHCEACQAEAAKDPSRSAKVEESSSSSSQTITIRVDSVPVPKTQETRLAIEGMTCSSCSGAITRHVQSLPGVSEVDVNLVLNSAVVIHDSDNLSVDTLVNEIEDLGYGATLVSARPLDTKGTKSPKATNAPSSPVRRTVFGIEGMTCSSCSGTIHATVSDLPGIESVSVSLISNSMEVVHDSNLAPSSLIADTVNGCGYEATEWKSEAIDEPIVEKVESERTLQLVIQGFCDECPARINARLEALGLKSYTPVSTTNTLTTLTYVPTPNLTIRTILASFPPPLSATIYTPPSMLARSRQMLENETRRLEKLFVASFVLAIPTFIFGVVGMSLLKSGNGFRTWCQGPVWGGAMRSVIALWVLATVCQVYVNRIFYERAWKGTFAHRRGPWRFSRLIHFGNMDLLVALSTSVAYAASLGMMIRDVRRGAEAVMATGSDTYFDSCVFLAFFILMGRVLEGRAKVKTGDAISLLGSMKPETALLMEPSTDSDDDMSLKKKTSNDDNYDLHFSSSTPISIPAEHLDLGDYILIQPGAVPPADGIIVSGSTTFDESSLTGEFMPVPKSVPTLDSSPEQSTVMTGTTNLTAPVVIRVTKVGDETMIQKIVNAVSEGQARKAPIERVADQITAIFIPIVVYLSLAVLVIWLSLSLSHAIPDSYLPGGRTDSGDRVFFSFEFAISCLVIACPCGIGLAAPTAQAVGSGMAARAGILAQGGGEAFQAAANVDTVVFDKTGTLTMGEAVVADSAVAGEQLGVEKEKEKENGVEGEWLFEAVRAMEAGSSHPLALAIVKFCEDRQAAAASGTTSGVKLLESEEVAGRGLRARVELKGGVIKTILVGNETFMINDNSASLGAGLSFDQVRKWRELGHSVVFVAVADGSHAAKTTKTSSESEKAGESSSAAHYEIKALLSVADTIRSEAPSTVARLQASGREVFMLTGDNETTARAVAVQLGIDHEHVKAGVLPTEKADFIKMLQEKKVMKNEWWRFGKVVEKNAVVVFCGDGLNDSAALATADVGVALAHGSQVTISAASFVLLSKTSIPSSLITLLDISRKVFNRQKANFGWAMVYNVALIPIAAGVLYPHKHTRLPPVWSALAMALSSVSVVTSSLALQWGL